MINIDIERFKGVFPAFYTAYDDDGNVDPERTRKLVHHFRNKGVKGLYITGSSGECPYLSVEERMLIMDSVKEAAGDDLTIIAHVGAASTRDSIRLAKHAAEIGCDAISSIPPIYYAMPENAIADYWTEMINASHLPFIIYNIPQNTGTNVSLSLFRKMLENEYTIGIKNTSLPVMDIAQFKEAGGDNVVVFNGPDEQFAAGRLMGADSGIGGTYGVMPELYLKLDELFRAGKLEELSRLQRTVTSIILELLSLGGLFAVCKEILSLQGMNIGKPRLPLPQLDPMKKDAVAKLKKRIDETISEWC